MSNEGGNSKKTRLEQPPALSTELSSISCVVDLIHASNSSRNLKTRLRGPGALLDEALRVALRNKNVELALEISEEFAQKHEMPTKGSALAPLLYQLVEAGRYHSCIDVFEKQLALERKLQRNTLMDSSVLSLVLRAAANIGDTSKVRELVQIVPLSRHHGSPQNQTPRMPSPGSALARIARQSCRDRSGFVKNVRLHSPRLLFFP